MYRYKFSNENKEYLLHFLQTAKSRNEKYDNMFDYQAFAKFLPADINLQNDLGRINKCNEVIDLTESESDGEKTYNSQKSLLEDLDVGIRSVNDPLIDDTLLSIKEYLQTEKTLCGPILCNLNELKCSQDFFDILSELNFEEVLNVGVSLKGTNISNDTVISYYIRYLLMKKLISEYSDQLQELLNDFSIRFSEILLEELTQILLFHEKAYIKVFLQFLGGFSMDFKQKLLRKFVNTCEQFHEHHFSVLEILIVPHVEFDILSKLLEIVSNVESSFSMNKSFGKLLMNLLKLLGKNVVLFEQVLNHVIGSHRSIWKSKLQKIFYDYLQENSVLSQSVN